MHISNDSSKSNLHLLAAASKFAELFRRSWTCGDSGMEQFSKKSDMRASKPGSCGAIPNALHLPPPTVQLEIQAIVPLSARVSYGPLPCLALALRTTYMDGTWMTGALSLLGQ